MTTFFRENGGPSRQATGVDEERPTPEYDPFSPQAIAASYDQFCRRISGLVDQLGLFSSECRQLGRSFALIVATGELREQLNYVLLMFYNNATYLSPLVQEPKDIGKELGDTDDLDAFPEQFERVAQSFTNVRERLNEFREYTDESIKIKALMHLFEKDIKYRAECLKVYRNRFNTIVIRRYVHSLTQELGEDLDNINSALVFFNKYGLSAIRYEQKRDADGVLNMSTMATFFSAVTATTLQISVGYDLTPIFTIVNTFWLCSLVLSIGAALNSLLALVWKQTTYGTRGRRLPLWVTVWIHISAPIFLTLSIACFSAGLVMFTYASKQARYTSILTLASTAVTSFGLVTVLSWIAYEQWISPILLHSPLSGNSSGSWKELRKRNRIPRRSRTGSISDQSSSSSSSDSSTSSLDIIARTGQMFHQSPISDFLSNKVKIRSFNAPETESRNGSFDHESQMPSGSLAVQEKNRSMWKRSARTISTARSATTILWHGTSRSVPRISQAILAGAPETPFTTSPTDIQAQEIETPLSMSLSKEPQHIDYEHGVIQDLEYSPDGRFLATTSCDKTTGASVTVNRSVANYQNTFRHRHGNNRASAQVAWSPNSRNLLVRLLDRSIELLDAECKLIATIKRTRSIEAVAWYDSSSFLSAERGTVHKLSLGGHKIAKYRFENLLVRDIAVVPNSDLLLVVGRVLYSGAEVLPHNSRGEKQFILYDMKTKEYRSRNPILDDARHIKVSHHISSTRNGFDILIGHKNKTPPSLWTLVPDLNNNHQLKQASVYLQLSGELTGPGHFADGDIYVWDRELGMLLHQIRAETMNTGLRNVACRSLDGQPGVMIASTGPKGLKIWTLVSERPGLSHSTPSGNKPLEPLRLPEALYLPELP